MVSTDGVGVGKELTSPDTKISVVSGRSVIGVVRIIFFLDCLEQSS
jgi:hypothetical protein